MSDAKTTTAASKLTGVTTSIRVIIEPRLGYVFRRAGETTLEAEIRETESWVRKFNDFLRDHRSQDKTYLEVERIKEDQCSGCKNKWETYIEEGEIRCASCGLEVVNEHP
jgi:hypothetical protein